MVYCIYKWKGILLPNITKITAQQQQKSKNIELTEEASFWGVASATKQCPKLSWDLLTIVSNTCYTLLALLGGWSSFNLKITVIFHFTNVILSINQKISSQFVYPFVVPFVLPYSSSSLHVIFVFQRTTAFPLPANSCTSLSGLILPLCNRECASILICLQYYLS